jgi:hypothetical protein
LKPIAIWIQQPMFNNRRRTKLSLRHLTLESNPPPPIQLIIMCSILCIERIYSLFHMYCNCVVCNFTERRERNQKNTRSIWRHESLHTKRRKTKKKEEKRSGGRKSVDEKLQSKTKEK